MDNYEEKLLLIIKSLVQALETMIKYTQTLEEVSPEKHIAGPYYEALKAIKEAKKECWI